MIDQTGGEFAAHLEISGNVFTNSGTIDAEAADDDSLTIDPRTFTNSGTIDVANGET